MAIVNVWRSNRHSKIFVNSQDSCRIEWILMELASQNLSAYLMIGLLAALVLGSLLYGIYTAFGAGSVQLTDQIEEHSRLHKLGIAHSHQGNGRAVARGGHAHSSHDIVNSWMFWFLFVHIEHHSSWQMMLVHLVSLDSRRWLRWPVLGRLSFIHIWKMVVFQSRYKLVHGQLCG
mgnify:CR=1 FL=1